MLSERTDLQFIKRQLAVGIQCLENLLVVLQHRVAQQKLQDLFDDVKYLVFDLIKDPLIHLADRKNSRVAQVDQVPGSFCLREFQNMLKVRDAHLAIGHDQVKDPEARRVGAGQKDLGAGFNVEIL